VLSRSLPVVVAASALCLAACSGDERDVPDVTDTPSVTVAGTAVPVSQPTVPTTSSVAVTSTAGYGSESVPATAGSTVAAPPVTCGPDPDETHPPPCD
jgi:hypothetical protein